MTSAIQKILSINLVKLSLIAELSFSMLRLDLMQLFNSCTRDVMSSSGIFSFSSTIFSINFRCISIFKFSKSSFNFSTLSEFPCTIVITLIRFSFNFSSGSFVAPTCVVTSDSFTKHFANGSEFLSTPISSIKIDPDSLCSFS